MKERREKEEERKWDGTCALGGGLEGEERFLHPGKPPYWQGDHLGQKGRSGGSEERAATGLWQAGQSEIYTDGLCHSPVCPSLRRVSVVWRVDLGEDCCWLQADNLRGQELCNQERSWRKPILP